MTPKPPKTLLAVALAVGALVGCGSDDGPTTIGTSDMWARPTAPDASNAAFYGTITNESEVTISFDEGYSRACETIELHESTMSDGVMSMGPADPADTILEPGESLVLEPMGLHVMCIGLDEPLVEGTPVDLELTFDGAGAVITEVAVEQR